MRSLLIVFLVFIFLLSCGEKESCDGFTLAKEFEIARNETLENCPKNISVTLLEIQDSRCPADVVCIWSGMIVIEGQLRIDGDEYDLKLSANENASGIPEVFSTEDYTVKLVDVLPYPDTSKHHQSADQRAILVISKRSS